MEYYKIEFTRKAAINNSDQYFNISWCVTKKIENVLKLKMFWVWIIDPVCRVYNYFGVVTLDKIIDNFLCYFRMDSGDPCAIKRTLDHRLIIAAHIL